MKILTITLAPAIDITYSLEHPVINSLNRARSFTLSAGGKGINVSRAVRKAALDDNNTDIDNRLLTIAPVGGESGEMFCNMLEKEGMPVTKLPIEAALRMNVSAIPDDGDDCEINAPGAAMNAESLANAERLILENVESGDIVCICGSCPAGVSKSYPATLCEKVKGKGAVCVIDCDGEALRHAVTADCPPDYIKPNADELSRLCADVGIIEKTPAENALAIYERTGRVTNVIVTLGGDGALLCTLGDVHTAVARRVKPNRIKGAGDTFLGAFVYSKFIRGDADGAALSFASSTATKYVEG